MPPNSENRGLPRRRPRQPARRALLQHRRVTVQWGLFAGLIAIIAGAIAAPHLTLLIVLALAFFGSAGLLTGWVIRAFNRWMG